MPYDNTSMTHFYIDRFNGRHLFLSNTYPVQVMLWEHICPSVEHGYQAAKMVLLEHRLRIIAEKDLGRVKRLGKSLPMRTDWEEVRDQTMEYLVRQKFQYQELLSKLVATGTALIVEGNWGHDNYWGACTCWDCTNKPQYNKLGKLLMKIREEAVLRIR